MNTIQDLLTATAFTGMLLLMPPAMDKLSGLFWQLIKIMNRNYHNKIMRG